MPFLRSSLLIIAVVFLAWLVRPGRQSDHSPLALAVAEVYGTTRLAYDVRSDASRLDLTLSDRRWRDRSSAELADTARAVARHALQVSRVERWGLPDTIWVHFEERHLGWLGLPGTGTSGYVFAAAEL